MSAASLMDWAFQTGISITVLVALILIFRRSVARHLGARAAYALWALPVIRLFMPAIPLLPGTNNVPVPVTPSSFETVYLPTLNAAPAAINIINWAPVLLTVWLAGAGLWLALQIGRQIRFSSNQIRATHPASPAVLRKIEDIATRLQMRRTPKILIAKDEIGPLVSGLMRPTIILPQSFETEFTEQQQNHALAHELSHIRSGDLWASASAILFRALNWPNPLVHLAAPLFRADQEAACDARVIALLGDNETTKTAYADTLLRAAKLSRNPVMPPMALTMTNPLKERLMNLKYNPSEKTSLRLALGGAAITALIATAPLTTAQTSPTPPEIPTTIVTADSVDKSVMKWMSNENGVLTSKHIEIITENGETTAWEIDEIGNRMQVNVDSLDMPMMPDMPGMSGDGNMRIIMKQMGDGESMDIDELAGGFHGDKKVIIKGFGDGKEIDIEKLIAEGHSGNVMVLEGESEMDVMTDHGKRHVVIKRMHAGGVPGKMNADVMVNAAGSMLDNIDTGKLDRKTRKKIEEARKALKEAEEALADAN